MNRRNVLKSFVSAVIGAALIMHGNQPASAGLGTRATSATIQGLPFIQTLDGVSLFYKDWGSEKPVVFIHSWALNSDMWQYQMSYLAGKGLRCIAYDRRGHGRSSQPGQGYDYNTLADDLSLLIEHLNLRDVTLVSHSMGAGEIVRYLSRHGAGRIARIVLLAPTTPFLLKTPDNPDAVEQIRFEELRNALSKDTPLWFTSAAPAFFGRGMQNGSVSREMVQWGINLCLMTSLKALIDCHLAMTETDFRAEMRKITVPALIIHGDADLSTPLALTGQKSAQLIPGSRLKIYEGAPHGLFLTHMERINSDLLEFINR